MQILATCTVESCKEWIQQIELPVAMLHQQYLKGLAQRGCCFLRFFIILWLPVRLQVQGHFLVALARHITFGGRPQVGCCRIGETIELVQDRNQSVPHHPPLFSHFKHSRAHCEHAEQACGRCTERSRASIFVAAGVYSKRGRGDYGGFCCSFSVVLLNTFLTRWALLYFFSRARIMILMKHSPRQRPSSLVPSVPRRRDGVALP